jgi:hypothetical protein
MEQSKAIIPTGTNSARLVTLLAGLEKANREGTINNYETASSKIWYLCDPAKNFECRKSSCVHNTESEIRKCDRTSHIQYAMLDEKGKPIIAMEQPKPQV